MKLSKILAIVIGFAFMCLNLISFDVLAGGGGCTFSDNCPGSPFLMCYPIAAQNGLCTSSNICNPGETTIAGGFLADECNMANLGGCTGNYNDPSGECSATISCMGMTASCDAAHSICGTVENTSYTQICIPENYAVGRVLTCTFSFTVSDIDCFGGAASLQWGIYPAASNCNTLAQDFPKGEGMLYCNSDLSYNSTVTGAVPTSFSPAKCYTIFFDGKAQASCNWTFDIIAPPVSASMIGSTTICKGTCAIFNSRSSCYTDLIWSNTENNFTSKDSIYNPCFETEGSYTITLTATANLGNCTGATYEKSTSMNIDVISCCNDTKIDLNSKTNVDCGGQNAALDIGVTGANPPYTFAWSNGMTTEDISGLIPGIYSVTVTDLNLCTMLSSYYINGEGSLAITSSIVEPLCAQDSTGTISLNVTGGTPNYSVNWNTSPPQTSLVATGLSAGSYVVTITDSLLCSATKDIYISAPAPITISVLSQSTPCYYDSSGAISVEVSGGVAPYQYTWNTTPPQHGATATGLKYGTYSVEVIDSNNCTQTSLFDLNLSGFYANWDITDTLLIAGDTLHFNNESYGAVSYLWNFGDSTSSTVPSPTHVYQTLGIYTVLLVVTDSSGCIDSLSSIINVDVSTDFVKRIPILKSTIYPNPASQNSSLIMFFGRAVTQIVMYDLYGRPVRKPTHVNFVSSTQVSIDLNGLNSGIYCAKIVDEFGNGYSHFVVVQ